MFKNPFAKKKPEEGLDKEKALKQEKKAKKKEELALSLKEEEEDYARRNQFYKKVELFEKGRKKEEKNAGDSFLEARHIYKIYSNRVAAVSDFSLDIKDGEFVVLVGPSGCGKSTTLRMIAGLEDITSGDLFIGGKYANKLEPKDRGVAMVFQSYALYPHMSVYENMAFGLSGMSKEEVSKRIHDAAKKLQIEEYLDRKPTALSGGQCQRVALGRAVVRNSSLFLLDEPLSNLDAKLRVQMRAELVRLHDSLGNTMIYVTHDQTEAMTMADRIVIMRDGVVQQIGTPQEVYEAPSNVFVATFMGSPSMNIVDAVYNKGQIIFQNGDKINLSPEMKQKHDDSCARRLKELSEKIKETREKIESKDESPVDFKAMLAELEEERGNVEKTLKEGVHEVYFGIRPEDFSLEEENRFQVKMGVKEMMGAESIIHFSFGEEEMSARLERELADKAFSASSISMPSSKIHLFERDSQKLIF